MPKHWSQVARSGITHRDAARSAACNTTICPSPACAGGLLLPFAGGRSEKSMNSPHWIRSTSLLGNVCNPGPIATRLCWVDELLASAVPLSLLALPVSLLALPFSLLVLLPRLASLLEPILPARPSAPAVPASPPLPANVSRPSAAKSSALWPAVIQFSIDVGWEGNGRENWGGGGGGGGWGREVNISHIQWNLNYRRTTILASRFFRVYSVPLFLLELSFLVQLILLYRLSCKIYWHNRA